MKHQVSLTGPLNVFQWVCGGESQSGFKIKKNVMTLQELREQLQEDLLCLTDGYLINELGEEYEDFEDKMCQIIVDNFKKLKTETK